MKVTAAIILGEAHWEIRVPLGAFETVEAGQDALNNATATLEVDGLRVTVHGQTCLMSDSDVEIRQLSEEAKARLGSAIDVQAAGGVEQATHALNVMDPAYVIAEDDFVPSAITLDGLVKRYGSGYQIDHIADQLKHNAH